MSDLLRMDYINSLPQPFYADGWPVHDIDVETGLMRIDVCGLLEVKKFSSVIKLIDANGTRHDTDTFYTDYVP